MTTQVNRKLSDQAPAFQALTALAAAHPALAAGYVVVAGTRPELLLASYADVEAAREALTVAPEALTVHTLSDRMSVEFTADVTGVPVRVWAAAPAIYGQLGGGADA